MYDAAFAVLNVVALGLIAGSIAGLIIGYIAGIQGPEWAGMTARNRVLNIVLVAVCSAVAIAVLSWKFLLP